MSETASSIKIRKPFTLRSGPGSTPCYFTKTYPGQIVVHKKTRCLVQFSIGAHRFTASSKNFRRRKGGAIVVKTGWQ